MAAPALKRQAVLHHQTVFDVSQRRACDGLDVDLTMARYYQSTSPVLCKSFVTFTELITWGSVNLSR